MKKQIQFRERDQDQLRFQQQCQQSMEKQAENQFNELAPRHCSGTYGKQQLEGQGEVQQNTTDKQLALQKQGADPFEQGGSCSRGGKGTQGNSLEKNDNKRSNDSLDSSNDNIRSVGKYQQNTSYFRSSNNSGKMESTQYQPAARQQSVPEQAILELLKAHSQQTGLPQAQILQLAQQAQNMKALQIPWLNNQNTQNGSGWNKQKDAIQGTINFGDSPNQESSQESDKSLLPTGDSFQERLAQKYRQDRMINEKFNKQVVNQPGTQERNSSQSSMQGPVSSQNGFKEREGTQEPLAKIQTLPHFQNGTAINANLLKSLVSLSQQKDNLQGAQVAENVMRNIAGLNQAQSQVQNRANSLQMDLNSAQRLISNMHAQQGGAWNPAQLNGRTQGGNFQNASSASGYMGRYDSQSAVQDEIFRQLLPQLSQLQRSNNSMQTKVKVDRERSGQVGNPANGEEPKILNMAEQRALALKKYLRKRKRRSFNKKVRYESRRKLAVNRPRVRGQFVKLGDLAKEQVSQELKKSMDLNMEVALPPQSAQVMQTA